jgi:hypothetical protein
MQISEAILNTGQNNCRNTSKWDFFWVLTGHDHKKLTVGNTIPATEYSSGNDELAVAILRKRRATPGTHQRSPRRKIHPPHRSACLQPVPPLTSWLMPHPLAPGLHIEEVPFASHLIEAVPTSITGFLATTGRGPLYATQLCGFPAGRT